jgi:hypothetical protein
MHILIPVHSFVDLITNSSSEVFVTADRKTVECFTKLVDGILKAAGSDKTCNDLFVVTLETRDGGYGDYKAIMAVARDPKNDETAKLISSLNDMFIPENIGND